MSSGYSAKTMDETANSEYSEDDLVENNLNTAHCSTSPPTKIRRVEKASGKFCKKFIFLAKYERNLHPLQSTLTFTFTALL